MRHGVEWKISILAANNMPVFLYSTQGISTFSPASLASLV